MEFTLNGQAASEDVAPGTSLLELLRVDVG